MPGVTFLGQTLHKTDFYRWLSIWQRLVSLSSCKIGWVFLGLALYVGQNTFYKVVAPVQSSINRFVHSRGQSDSIADFLFSLGNEWTSWSLLHTYGYIGDIVLFILDTACSVDKFVKRRNFNKNYTRRIGMIDKRTNFFYRACWSRE